MEGLLRLEQEALETNNHNIILIFNHLKEIITQKEKFNNSEKNIKDMYSFICDKARKSATDNVAIIDDKAVAVNTAPESIPAADKILGLTTSIYAIVINVVIPAINSCFVFVLFSLSLK
mgnify:CR=1 FL=1